MLPFLSANLPTLAANGPGAAVNVSQYAGSKTISNAGNGVPGFEPQITIEIANDAAGLNFVPIYTFQGNSVDEVTIPVAARFMRAVTANYRGGGAAVVNVAAETDAALFATLVAPASVGSGVGVSTSSLPEYKTVIVTGTFKGSVNIEVSEDAGTTWTGVMSFSAPGQQTQMFSAQQMRVTRVGDMQGTPGLPIIDIAADTFGAGGGVGGAGVAVSAGTQLATTGTAVFSNSNGMSFGMSNSSIVTASNDAFRSLVAFGGSASGSILSFVNTNGITFGIAGQTLTASVQTAGGTATGVAISAGTEVATTGAVVFSNSNGISFGLNAQTLTATFAAIKTISASGGSVTNGQLSFANSNSVTFGINAGTLTASVPLETPFGVSAGTQSVSTGTLVFSNSNGVTFGMSGSSRVTASVAAETPFGISAGTQSVSTGTLVFSNSNNVSFGMSGSNQITASASFAAETPFGISAGSQSVSTGTLVYSNSNGISFGMVGSSRVTAAFDGIRSVIAGSQTAAGTGFPTVSFANSNGVTFGMSGSGTITAQFSGINGGTVSALSQYPEQPASYQISNGSLSLNHFTPQAFLRATQAYVPLALSGNSNSSGALTVNFGVYTMSADSAALATTASRLVSWSSGSATSASSLYGGVSGTRYRSLAVDISFLPGDYLLAYQLVTSNDGTWSVFGRSPYALAGDENGWGQQRFIDGYSSSFTSAFPVSFNATAAGYIRTDASAPRQPAIVFLGAST